MSTLPILNELSDATNTVAQQKTNFEDVNRAIKQMPGGPSGVAIPTLTIAAGLVTPGDGIAGMFLIDTEAAAATDDLTNIIQTNLPEPSMIIISIANNARSVVVRSAFGGAGQIILASGANHTLTDIRRSLVLRRNGALWDQVTPSMIANPTIHGGLVSADPTVALGIASKQYVDSLTEEGTWVPSVGGTATYSIQQGRYTKVGNVVTVSCLMQINVIGTGSAIAISGLPFAVLANTVFIAPIMFASLAISVVTLVAHVGAGLTSIQMRSLTAAGTGLSNTNAVIGTSTSIFFSGSYLTV